ncbi:carbohydrate kinase family protein [Plebeiibacterium sediminum]|uniref:Carbohydrate kinase n=1 Tax=Plebeiibacterium sediminum TaxID=2992112 RepID=A0AAE3M556_9BACT|nr:carbohydrate kinase [Plebeiobacterium sediminum]MCW3786850.1 carbohydrate kinase [Plebeiobacterium sediminum]
MEQKEKKILCIGEVLWDMLPTGAKPGGAPMNVALHLKNIGLNVQIASKVGNDEKGQKLIDFLEQSGLSTDLIQIDNQLPTSEVLVNLDNKDQASYTICEPVAWDAIEFTPELEKVANESDVLIYGSLASRNPVTCGTIMKCIDRVDFKIIDVNLRPPYDKQDIVEPLVALANFIKLNDDEMREIGKWNCLTDKSEEYMMTWLGQKLGVDTICMTKGPEGSVLLDKGEFHKHSGYRVETIDSVGAGDAFLAGFISSYLKDNNPIEALYFASATGAYVASKEGATPAYDLEQIKSIITNL